MRTVCEKEGKFDIANVLLYVTIYIIMYVSSILGLKIRPNKGINIIYSYIFFQQN